MTSREKLCLLLLIPSASLGSAFISPELASIKAYFSLSTHQLSLIMTYYLTGYLVGQGIWGYLSTLLGKVKSIRLGRFIAVIGALILLYAYYHLNYGYFILARMLMGFGASSSLVCGFIIIKENLEKERQKKFITLVALFFTAAIYTSMVLSGHLLKYTSVSLIMWVFLVLELCFLILSLCIRSLSNLPIKHSIDHRQSFEYKETTKIIIYSFVLSMTTVITYLYAFYAPLITAQCFSLAPETYSTFSFFNLFFVILGGSLFTYLNRILSEYSICIYGLLIIILSSLILVIVNTSMHLTIFVFFMCSYLMDFMLGMIYPAATCLALEPGRNKAIASTIMNTIKLSLPIIAIYVSSRFFQNTLYGFSLTIIICAIMFLLLLILLKASFQPKNSAEHYLT